ncbi:MAG: carboxypeptidase-like regulatory domain-containing protein [Candidatus Woesebacteria bacterium]|jgi:hypothetical protein
MQFLPAPKKVKSGQVLISLLVGVALFAILSHALFTLVSASYSIVTYTRARIAAKHLAQEKMESIRNLPYDDIGTVGGIPSGQVEPSESVFRNGLNYLVETSIVFIDDEFDGLAPIDLLPSDYKRVRVEVTWGGLAASGKNPIIFISDISPKGIETTQGGGTISILVFDANAQPVPQANVHIVATETTPTVDLNQETSSEGRVILPGAPTCTSCYQITVTKDGYSTDRTYSTDEVANPDKPHQSSLEGYLTEVSFSIDKVSTLTIQSHNDRENNFEPLGNVSFTLRGNKTIGTDSSDELVYKYNQSFATDGSGELEIDEIEWDDYKITTDAASGYDITGTNPLLDVRVLPDTAVRLDFSVTTDTTHSLLVSFTDPADNPIASVSARLYDDTGYEATSSSGISGDPDFGQSFFGSLTNKIYHFTATASGFIDFSEDISVAGFTTEKIIMNPE